MELGEKLMDELGRIDVTITKRKGGKAVDAMNDMDIVWNMADKLDIHFDLRQRCACVFLSCVSLACSFPAQSILL